jgi:hypothetical protein
MTDCPGDRLSVTGAISIQVWLMEQAEKYTFEC